jgi:hypothetical protein
MTKSLLAGVERAIRGNLECAECVPKRAILEAATQVRARSRAV